MPWSEILIIFKWDILILIIDPIGPIVLFRLFTDFILSHVLQFVHRELLLLQAIQHMVTQVGELAQRVGEAPQTLVNHFAESEESVGHGRPSLPQSDLKQRPDNSSSILRQTRGKKIVAFCFTLRHSTNLSMQLHCTAPARLQLCSDGSLLPVLEERSDYCVLLLIDCLNLGRLWLIWSGADVIWSFGEGLICLIGNNAKFKTWWQRSKTDRPGRKQERRVWLYEDKHFVFVTLYFSMMLYFLML